MGWISILIAIQLCVEVLLAQIECIVQGLGDIGIKAMIRVSILRTLSNYLGDNVFG